MLRFELGNQILAFPLLYRANNLLPLPALAEQADIYFAFEDLCQRRSGFVRDWAVH